MFCSKLAQGSASMYYIHIEHQQGIKIMIRFGQDTLLIIGTEYEYMRNIMAVEKEGFVAFKNNNITRYVLISIGELQLCQ